MKFIKLLPSLAAVLWSSISNAQEKDLVLSSKYNSDRSYSIIAEKMASGTYTLVLNFRELSNTSTTPKSSYLVQNNNDVVETFTPLNKDQNISSSYTYTYVRGKLNPKYSPLFLYALPYANGKSVYATEATFLNARYFGSTTPDDWKSYHFTTPNADTVVAARKGTVVSVTDTYETDQADVKFTNKVNTVIIEHNDGTIANYRGFKKGIFVKDGQTVFPGTPLGINSLMNDKYRISFMITYLKSVDFAQSRNGLKDSKSLYGFITPYFATTTNPNGLLQNQSQYISVITPEIVQKEMTKKELKNLNRK